MFTVKNPGTWQQYLRANPKLPVMEAKRRFLIEQQNYLKVTGIGRPKSGDGVIQQQDGLPSNCIAFVNNTTDGTYSEIGFTTSGPTTYTMNWGDGTVYTGEVDGSSGFDYTYADPDQSYNCTLCFGDISLVTRLDFLGDD